MDNTHSKTPAACPVNLSVSTINNSPRRLISATCLVVSSNFTGSHHLTHAIKAIFLVMF